MEQAKSNFEKERYGEGINFERLRRITGYIGSGDYRKSFNDAKKRECEERVKHDEQSKEFK